MGIQGKNITEDNLRLIRRYELLEKNKGHTAETIKAYQNELRLYAKFLGDTYFNKADHKVVEDYLIYCQDQRTNCDKTINRKYTALNTFYQTMIKKDYFDMRNPFDKIDKIKVHKKLAEHLEYEEYLQMIDYLDKSNEPNKLRDAALIVFAFSSACRLSEIYQQNKNNLNFDRKQFKVLGKGQKERLCIFSDDALERIKVYLATRKDDNEALFVSRQGGRLCKKSIQDAVKNAGKRAGVNKNVHPHILRHTRAMYLLKQGVPLETIQRLLGHSNIATTQVYAHSNLEDLQYQIENIDKISA